MKNFNLKKILSVLLACSIIMSIVQVPIFATDTADTSTSRGKVSMVYLGTGASPATTPQEVPDTSTWTADPTSGTTFWVGLCLSDLAKMDATASSGSDGLSSHFSVYQNSDEYDWSRESGIFNIASGIEYASKYIQPNGYVNDAAFKNKTLAMLKTLTPAYGSAYAGDDGAAISGDVSTNENREDLVISEEDSPKMAYFSISSSQSVDSKIFGYKDNINNDPIYIIAVNFKLVEMPTAGTKVLSAALNPENFLMQTGSATDLIWQGTWNKGRDIVPDNNLKNHIDYMGDLDLFPAAGDKYNVTLAAAGDTNATFEVKLGDSVIQETVAGNKTYSLESGKNYTITAKASDGKAYKFDKWTSSDFTSS